MGLISGLLGAPLAPLRGVLWTTEHIAQAARRQQRNELHAQLKDYEQRLQRGEITEAEFDRVEDELLDQLDELGPPES